MLNLYDIAYYFAVGASAPVWLLKSKARQKVRRAFAERMGHVPGRAGENPAVLIHAVSLGEINATRGLVQRLRQLRPDLHTIISTTTDTGFARAQELYGKPEANPQTTVIRYPLDFTSAINRALDALRPNAIVLMELEAWPNFLHQCGRRNIPVLLVNGRMTAPSFKRYHLALPIVKRMFGRLAAVCVQEPIYADRFSALGVNPTRIQVTGTMKFDTATVSDRVPGDDQLAADLGLHREGDAPAEPHDQSPITDHRSPITDHHPLWICGSTGPGEEPLILEQYRKLLPQFPSLRLAIIPRKPERFDEVAAMIEAAGFPLIRRSKLKSATANAVILGDTMGELRKFYSLADVVFVGRTLTDLGPKQHGSDMIEPAALGKPTIVGPFTGNFADVMSAFRQASAIVEVTTAEQLGREVSRLLSSTHDAHAMGRRARDVVVNQKGATERHVQIIARYL